MPVTPYRLETEGSPGEWGGAVSSFIFWVCLFVAAGCYAVVVLAPKLIVFENLEAEYAANQWRLVSLEKQVDGLRKVIAAAQNDPAFVRELARSDFEVAHPDEQRIPVDPRLTLQIGGARTVVPPRRAALPGYLPLLQWVAGSRQMGNLLLLAAGGLIIAAFSLLPVRSSAAEESTRI
jgi:cell division protein FtsB